MKRTCHAQTSSKLWWRQTTILDLNKAPSSLDNHHAVVVGSLFGNFGFLLRFSLSPVDLVELLQLSPKASSHKILRGPLSSLFVPAQASIACSPRVILVVTCPRGIAGKVSSHIPHETSALTCIDSASCAPRPLRHKDTGTGPSTSITPPPSRLPRPVCDSRVGCCCLRGTS